METTMMSSETRERAFAVLAKRLDELLNMSGDVAFVLLMRASSTGDMEIVSNCSLTEEVKLMLSQANDLADNDDPIYGPVAGNA
jgi:hypothetical protein